MINAWGWIVMAQDNPNTLPEDFDVYGPFDSQMDALNWSADHLNAYVRGILTTVALYAPND